MNKFLIGDLIYLIRCLSGLNQEEFAKAVGVVQSTISKIERNILEDITFKTVNEISARFKVPLKCFQTLSIRVNRKEDLNRIIPQKFYENGTYSSETILNLLNGLNEDELAIIKERLKFEKQFLLISNVRYNDYFCHRLKRLFDSELIQKEGRFNAFPLWD